MWIVAIAWIYVVLLMAATETSVVAGIMTFFGYCVLPLSIVFYITGSKRRRARKAASARTGVAAGASTQAGHGTGRGSGSSAPNGSGGNSDDGDGGGDGD